MANPGPKPTNIAGQRFGRLVVESLDETRHGRGAAWWAVCDCGGRVSVLGAMLRSGKTTSCGCRAKEALCEGRTSHSLAHHELYKRWHAMLSRCSNPNIHNFNRYGGRGISVCERWLAFENFHADMASSFQPGLSLDRIDNAKGYSPENVRWANSATQQRNTRRNVWVLTPSGVMLLSDASILWSRREAAKFERVDHG